MLDEIDDPSIDQLVQQVGDIQANWEVRYSAARMLIQRRDVGAADVLLARVQDDNEHAMVRCMAVAALRNIRALQVVPILRRLIEDQQTDPRLVGFSAAALGVLGDSAAAPRLLSLLSHPDARVRRLAAFALGELRELQAQPALSRLLEEDSLAFVRKEAVGALGKIGDHGSIDLLIAALDDHTYTVRAEAIYALAKMPDKRSIEPLMVCLDDTEEYVVLAAVIALGHVGAVQAVPKLEWIRDHRIADFGEADVFQHAATEAIARIQQHKPQ